MRHINNKEYGGGAMIAIVALIVVALLGVLGYVGYKALQNQDGKSQSTESKNVADVSKKSSASEAFGVKVGMSQSEVEKVLGQPMALNQFMKACTETAEKNVATLGYDNMCTYKVGQQQEGSYVIPSTSVKYLDKKLVEATKTDADGTITTLTGSGVNTIEAKN